MKKVLSLFMIISLICLLIGCHSEPLQENISVKIRVFDNEERTMSLVSGSKLSDAISDVEISKLLGEVDYISTVNDNVEDKSFILKDGDYIKIYKQGVGTEADPLAIGSGSDFISAIKEGKSVIFVSDISIPADTWFGDTFVGALDGKGFKLIIEEPPMDVKYQSKSEFALFNEFNGTIKNLDYHTNGMKGIIFIGYENLNFENVDTYGEMNAADTNIGPYVIFLNAKTSFKNCNNYANIIDRMGGNHYGAAFVGGYMNLNDTSNSEVTFENCNNYGVLSFGQNAALLIGNPSKYKAENVKVSNCGNYGTIQAFENVGVNNWTDSSDLTSINKNGGSIKKIKNTITSFSVTADGKTNIDNESVKYLLQFNISFKVKGENTVSGNRNMTIEGSLNESGNLPSSVSMTEEKDKHCTIDEKNTLLVYPYAYDFTEEENDFSSISKLTYYAVEYDADGLLVGSAIYKQK